MAKNNLKAYVLVILILSLLAFIYLKPEERAYVSITFDDGYLSQLNASRILDSYGFSGTFYIISGLSSFDGIPLMNQSQIAGLQARGHEVGGHSLTHKRPSEITEEEFRQEVVEDRKALEEMGFNVSSFAYPHGEGIGWSDIVKNAGYKNARSIAWGVNPLPVRNYDELSSITITHNNLPALRNYLDMAKQQRGWLIVSLHSIGGTRPDVDITEDDFIYILNAINNSGLKVVRVGDK